MAKKKYSEKLKDPRWQKKRLKILERDDWKCQTCGDPKETLHVHHLYYEKDRDPWDYPDESLITLCADCHAEEGEGRYGVQDSLIYALRIRGYTNPDIEDISNGIRISPYNPQSMPLLPEIILSVLANQKVLKYLDSELYKAMHGESSIFTEKLSGK